MEMRSETQTETPPRLIAAFGAGFNTVATHIHLILFPVLLDLWLWFGPHFRVRSLLAPFVSDMITNLTKISPPEMMDMVTTTQKIWEALLERFNFFLLLRTTPIGVPSLMAAEAPVASPLGTPIVVEIGSIFSALLLFVLITLAGLVFGALYFYAVARFTSDEKTLFSLDDASRQVLTTILFTVALFLVAIFLLIPLSLLASFLALINLALAEVVLFAVGLLLLWFLYPLVFTPHGIFAYRQNLISSLLTSARLVRFFLPGTGLFILLALLVSQGLNSLWRVPPETSWMAMIGVLGHAFISTALLAASFIYYRRGIRWMQQNIQRAQAAPKA